MRLPWLVLLLLLLAPAVAVAQPQSMLDAATTAKLAATGWEGFLDPKFLSDSVGALGLAIILGAAIGYHPMTPHTVDTLGEADMPKVYVLYAFVGAVIGVTVREFGMVVGFVVFGLGGLMRFRTDTGSTRDTGRMIAVTLAGLIAGLGLPAFAVITTVFAFVLIWLFDSRPACRIKVERLPQGRLDASADAYRATLKAQGCKVINERRALGKERLEFIVRLPKANARDKIHAALCAISADVRGEVEWEVE